MKIPPGFKFHPNVEDTFRYLRNKVYGIQEPNVKLDLIKEIDLYQSSPSDHGLSKEECTYFFTEKVAINQSGRTRISDRKTKDGKGYWLIRSSKELEMGIKNTLTCYLKGGMVEGKGLKTDWIMHEYVLKPKPADAKVKVNKTMVLCRIYHKKQKKSRGTDVCNAREQEPDTSKDGSREKLMMIESSQEYQQKNTVAPSNEEFVCINLCSDDDKSSQGYDQLKNSIPAKVGRGRDGSRVNLMMTGSNQEYQQMNIAAPAYI